MFQRKLRGARLQLLEKEPCSEAGGRRSISRKFIGRRGTRQMVKSRQPSCKLSEQKPRACPEVYTSDTASLNDLRDVCGLARPSGRIVAIRSHLHQLTRTAPQFLVYNVLLCDALLSVNRRWAVTE